MKGKIFQTVLSLIFLAVGVAVLFLAISSFVDEAHYKKTVATVISADVGYSDEGKLKVVSTYEYFVDGERYVKKTAATNASSASFEGETFTVKYDPNSPEKVQSDGVGIIFMTAFGLIFTCAGGGVLIGTLTGKLK